MSDRCRMIADNLAVVRQRIAEATAAAGRSAESVKLVAVTKYVGPIEAAALLAAGHCDLGESRPQELWSKAAVPELMNAKWHLIGPLQRNKVKRTLPFVTMTHSVDSERLLSAIDQVAAGTPQNVLLEVNCSGEAEKHGFTADSIAELIPQLEQWPGVRICGLMTMAGRIGGGAAGRDFAVLRALRDQLVPLCPDGVELNELSMGMSGDFEQAIREGATIVRVGSALFDGI